MSQLYPQLKEYIAARIAEFEHISAARRRVLENLAGYIRHKHEQSDLARLVFICTHNSRRSHISQIWTQVAAYYYHLPGVETFSGGTEATAFNYRAVQAMQAAGLAVNPTGDPGNPRYLVRYAADNEGMICFSKRFDDPYNPQENFCAVMTCSDADEACPVVSGAERRIAVTYDDPKAFDGTPQEAEKYAERVQQIAREMLYTISRVGT